MKRLEEERAINALTRKIGGVVVQRRELWSGSHDEKKELLVWA